ncbi:MAG: hypothetical protein ACKODX_22575 [Gemmata sp.]
MLVAIALALSPADGEDVKKKTNNSGTHESEAARAATNKSTTTEKNGTNEHTHTCPARLHVHCG